MLLDGLLQVSHSATRNMAVDSSSLTAIRQ
jgi:hypothetical protein